MLFNGLKHLLAVTLVITDQCLTPTHVYLIHGKEIIDSLFPSGLCAVYPCTGETFDYELTKIGYTGIYKITAIEDRFIPHSSVAAALKYNYLDADSMYSIMKND